MPVNRESARLGGVARLITEAEHLVANWEPDQRDVTSKAQRSRIEAMSGMGQKQTSITRLQMVRYSPRGGHWASVCLLLGVKRTETNDPQNVRS